MTKPVDAHTYGMRHCRPYRENRRSQQNFRILVCVPRFHSFLRKSARARVYVRVCVCALVYVLSFCVCSLSLPSASPSLAPFFLCSFRMKRWSRRELSLTRDCSSLPPSRAHTLRQQHKPRHTYTRIFLFLSWCVYCSGVHWARPLLRAHVVMCYRGCWALSFLALVSFSYPHAVPLAPQSRCLRRRLLLFALPLFGKRLGPKPNPTSGEVDAPYTRAERGEEWRGRCEVVDKKPEQQQDRGSIVLLFFAWSHVCTDNEDRATTQETPSSVRVHSPRAHCVTLSALGGRV